MTCSRQQETVWDIEVGGGAWVYMHNITYVFYFFPCFACLHVKRVFTALTRSQWILYAFSFFHFYSSDLLSMKIKVHTKGNKLTKTSFYLLLYVLPCSWAGVHEVSWLWLVTGVCVSGPSCVCCPWGAEYLIAAPVGLRYGYRVGHCVVITQALQEETHTA